MSIIIIYQPQRGDLMVMGLVCYVRNSQIVMDILFFFYPFFFSLPFFPSYRRNGGKWKVLDHNTQVSFRNFLILGGRGAQLFGNKNKIKLRSWQRGQTALKFNMAYTDTRQPLSFFFFYPFLSVRLLVNKTLIPDRR